MTKLNKWHKKKFISATKKGLSLLLAVVLINVIVLFSVGVTLLVVDSARQAGNVRQGTQAYYAAEAGLEKALIVNKLLTENGKNVGASEEGDLTDAQGAATGDFDASFSISGKANDDFGPATVNGTYIIPFPWTGDVPWHGEGSIPEVGGCDPQKPPEDNGDNPKTFDFIYVNEQNAPTNDSADLLDHPCNWGKLAVGEKVSIPLYGLDDGGIAHSFTEFTLRLRTPCINGNEMCPHTAVDPYRMELNCFDKGSDEERCTQNDSAGFYNEKGEVVVAWQIDSDNNKSLLPYELINPFTKRYIINHDSQLFEGRINYSSTATPKFEGLNQSKKGQVINGGDITITSFLSNPIERPVLKLTVVGELIGCYGNSGEGSWCQYMYDSPTDENGDKNDAYKGIFKIPYLEYQVQFTNPPLGSLPINKENTITAEGQSGSFVQNIQVKVNNDNSGLEYVIQQ